MIRIVLKVDIHNEREKLKVLKAVTIPGIVGSNVDTREKTLTVIGHVDAGKVWKAVRCVCYSTIISVETDFDQREREEEEARFRERDEHIRGDVTGGHSYNHGIVSMNYHQQHHQPAPSYVQHYGYPYPEPVVITDDTPGCVVM
ncbi:Heavy metal-associated isoprenylated plant protein 39 [Linum grandiflorum]